MSSIPLSFAAVFLLFGYLLGSIPFGLLLTRAAGLGDVRKIGSGNIGATNVLRTGNKGLAAATLFLDGLKGFVAVLLVQRYYGFDPGLAAGLGAFLGHLFPVWLGFKGGKGVATFIGVVFAVEWQLGLVFCAAWLAVAIATRYSSLAALVATLVTSGAAYLNLFHTALPHAAIGGLLSVMLVLKFYKHRENISRLLAGTESRIGAKG